MASLKYPLPPDNIPVLNMDDYMRGKEISSSGYGVYEVLNHPDKLLKIMNLFDAAEDAIHEDNPWTELKMSHIAGEIGIGAKIYGYYVEDRNIHMIMELIEGTLLKNTSVNEKIYNKVLKVVEMLIDNGVKNTDINGGNIIIQNDGSIKVIDYGQAYEISKLSGSKKQNLIIKMAKYAKPHDYSEKYNDEMSKRLESKLTKLKQGRGKTKRKARRKSKRKAKRKSKRKTKQR
jgi:tRNA A-37 threonylcarbamoyl transferase component Bud32